MTTRQKGSPTLWIIFWQCLKENIFSQIAFFYFPHGFISRGCVWVCEIDSCECATVCWEYFLSCNRFVTVFMPRKLWFYFFQNWQQWEMVDSAAYGKMPSAPSCGLSTWGKVGRWSPSCGRRSPHGGRPADYLSPAPLHSPALFRLFDIVVQLCISSWVYFPYSGDCPDNNILHADEFIRQTIFAQLILISFSLENWNPPLTESFVYFCWGSTTLARLQSLRRLPART